MVSSFVSGKDKTKAINSFSSQFLKIVKWGGGEIGKLMNIFVSFLSLKLTIIILLRMTKKNPYKIIPFYNVSYQDLFIDLIIVRYPVKKLTNVFEVREKNNN